MTSDFDTIREAIGEPAIYSVNDDGTTYVYTTDVQRNQHKKDALVALNRVQAAAEQAEKALYKMVMAEPLEVDGRTMWPSFSGELQNKAFVALAVLRGKDTG